ncbi:MAG: carbamoyl phosphate synthase large subunit, partial [Gammaproteobacteria bacterium]
GEGRGLVRSVGGSVGRVQLAAGRQLPRGGRALVSVRDRDKQETVEGAKGLVELGFELVCTRGTAETLTTQGISCTRVNKVTEGRPDIVDMLKNDEIQFIVNTTEGKQAIADSYTIRRTALQHGVTYTTTMAGARAIVLAMR